MECAHHGFVRSSRRDHPAHRTGMSHGQLHRDPVVAHRGVGPQEDRELRLAGVALFQTGQPGHRRGQSKVADALSQDSRGLLLAAVPVGSLSPAGAATAAHGRTLQHLQQLVLEAVLAEIPAATNRLRRLVIDLAAVVGRPGFQPLDIGPPPPARPGLFEPWVATLKCPANGGKNFVLP